MGSKDPDLNNTRTRDTIRLHQKNQHVMLEQIALAQALRARGNQRKLAPQLAKGTPSVNPPAQTALKPGTFHRPANPQPEHTPNQKRARTVD
jgi:hypothetical protein